MADYILLCSNCGTKNRIGSGQGQAICGRCKKSLVLSNSSNGISPFAKRFWLVIVIIAGIFLYNYEMPTKTVTSGSYHLPPQVEQPVFSEPPVAIEPGVITKNYDTGLAPLQVKTNLGSDYLVKLVDIITQQVTMITYIKGGQSFEIDVPLGTYEVRYASGQTWYGEKYLFGPETAYAKADKLFNFNFDGRQYSGYTIELIKQVHGNLDTKPIDEKQF